jgi:hypothetical protein
MNQHTQFNDVCDVTCISNGLTEVGEILTFREKEFISLTIRRSVKLRLNWNETASLYVGSMAGLEFQSEGPSVYTYRSHR